LLFYTPDVISFHLRSVRARAMGQTSATGVGLPTGYGGDFCYEEAFSRNLGWVTDWEQQALRGKRVAIAGMGGVGGFHLLTLARFGIGAFNIADPDKFELVNFNRQVGATLATIGRPKPEVMAEMARQINPELQIACSCDGLTEANLDAFLVGADLCIDGLDFFVLEVRRKLNARCRELGIPVINAAPLGMGTAFLIFTPESMSFEEWFNLDGLSEEQQYVSYLVGMAPSALHRSYLADVGRVDLRGHRGPSTVAGCELCAAVASVETVKLLLHRGTVRSAPYYHHFDAYRGRWTVRRLRGGNRHPVQRLKIALTRRFAAKASQVASIPNPMVRPQGEIENILGFARWAPSGDNTQPWRFEIIDQERVIIHLTPEADDIYDYRGGEATLLAGGTLLESILIAASHWNRKVEWAYERCDAGTHRITVFLRHETTTNVDPLFSYVPMRSVDRRPYRLRSLTKEEKSALSTAIGPDLEVEWYETAQERWRLSRLNARATAIRLMTPEAFRVHQRVLDWDRRFSPDRVPAAAAGMSKLSLGPMRWAMESWARMRLLNFVGGILSAQIQMDYVPGLRSAAFFALRIRTRAMDGEPRPVRLLRAGMAVQRFWLTATALRLALQPAFATLVFAEYGSEQQRFTYDERALSNAQRLGAEAALMFGKNRAGIIFLGRIGEPNRRPTPGRSVRRALDDLLVTSTSIR